MDAAMTEARALLALSDEQVVERIRAGEPALFEIIMRRYNQRLYRTARAITGDDGEAEDVVQDAYVRAYANLAQFAGRASFATWLTRITAHEAIARLRRRGRFVDVEDPVPTLSSELPDPEEHASDRELARALEAAIEALPDVYRSVFVLREVEELSTAETAACLEITEQTAKTRLHRARTLLRNHLVARARAALPAAFQFAGARCDAIVAGVLARIATASER
jgi:RNA polymerase sigma-70 factor (ECF subfamily)